MGAMQPATYAAGVRRRFEDLPPAVISWVADQLGGAVVSVQNQVGGFSPGAAAVVTGATGQAVFVKAVGSTVNAGALDFYRAERELAARLPRLPGIVPAVAGADLEIDEEFYAVLVFPALAGATPQHPWRVDDLGRVLDALHALSVQLTPSPWPANDTDQRLPDFFRWWERILADAEDPWAGDPWIRARAAGLVAAEEQLRLDLPGGTLSHTDLRADNVLLGRDDVWFVDWAHAQNAAPWVDAGLLLADVIASYGDVLQGGSVDVAAIVQGHPALRGVDPALIWRLMLGLAGALHGMSTCPSPPGLPTIRGWQATTSQTLFEWCRRAAPAGPWPLAAPVAER
ncbi:MAG TPA: aminoglycoside phosphotransferase family protein [Propionibacteriaceae bacterium]|nr:aminoglycoside phosphotransferase family protein [Propionibacteriaceae bacterium]